jgi:hypothetical protein
MIFGGFFVSRNSQPEADGFHGQHHTAFIEADADAFSIQMVKQDGLGIKGHIVVTRAKWTPSEKADLCGHIFYIDAGHMRQHFQLCNTGSI